MALQTFRKDQQQVLDLFYQPIAGEFCFVDITYDDVDRRVRSIRAVNPPSSPWDYGYRVSRPDGSREQKGALPPDTDLTIPIGTGVAVRLQLVVNSRGRLDGIDAEFSYPSAW